MSTTLEATIVPITLTVGGRTGLTLWAPPWEDDEGEEWQGFLGDGAKILLFPNTRELADFIASGEENDLSDHPAWRRLVGSTPEYEDLVSDEVSYQGKDGRKRWSELGDVIAETWERAIARVESWLNWRGDFAENELDAESVWDRVGAEPIELVLADATYLTIRAEVDDEVLFLGEEGNISVFTEPADLARYCRTADQHELTRLERWEELEDADDDAFEVSPDASYDLTAPSTRAADLVRELVAFCDLDEDSAALD